MAKMAKCQTCAYLLAVLCVNHLSILTLALQQQATAGAAQTQNQTHSPAQGPLQHQPPSQWRTHTRSNTRHNAVAPTQSPNAIHNEIKDLMSNLHDRVGLLATLDEDQRHRLEVIDKKIEQLLESNTGRMESLKAQQLNFQQRMDSFEHIQRLTRSTLDELKGETDKLLGPRLVREAKRKLKNRERLPELSRSTRQAKEDETSYVEQNMATLFRNQPTSLTADFNGTVPDIDGRLNALATLLTSLAYSVRETQQDVGTLVQNTNNIRRRLPLRKGNAAAATSVAVHPELATSCLQSELSVNGIIKLQLTPESEPFYVPCENDGWSVILNRSTDDINFMRSWLEYKEGFGNLAGDFFIGLDKLHALTHFALHELRIILEDFSGNVAYAGYDTFAISGERESYALSLLGKYQKNLSPPAGDSLSYQAGAKFSTFDNDNDNCLECNCAQLHKAGGWFNACGTSNLLGVYHSKNFETAGETGIYWDTFQGKNYSLRRVKMLIRPVFQDEARR